MKLWWILRSTILWIVSILVFPITGLILVGATLFRSQHELDSTLRFFTRTTLMLAGARLRIRHSANFDPERTAIFICNHVNIFDPMAVITAVPQHMRGMELESHFRIPIYGAVARSCGNIPVPQKRDRAALREMIRSMKAAYEAGLSIVVFAEGHRTRDGHVAPFQRGIFNMVSDLGIPIIPMSLTGAHELKRYNSLLLKPATVTVWLHDTVETAGLERRDMDALRGRVHETVSRPVEQALRGDPWSPELAAYTEVRSGGEIPLLDRTVQQTSVPS
jgi:1-acyl-sn-glycerol-3-phosphate acyltransferase